MIGPIDWTRALALIVILLISIDFHEFAHAFIAYKLGDDTPARNGQLSLNPFVHMDQFGIVLLVLTALLGRPFTYGRTLIQPSNLRFGPQRGGAIVAAAGPGANAVIAALAGVALRVNVTENCALPANYNFFIVLALYVNCALVVINLIPFPPLDGFSIVSAFLTARQLYSLAPLVQYGPIVLIVAFVLFPEVRAEIFVAVNHLSSFIYPNALAWYDFYPNSPFVNLPEFDWSRAC